MPTGGARINSGPRRQEDSGRSDRAGFKLAVLDAAGYTGRAPAFPLPNVTKREAEMWKALWRLPQGLMWSKPGSQWLFHTIGLYVRQFVKCEDADVSASHIAQLHRLGDQIGMTPAGLAAHGYKVADKDAVPAPSSGKPKSSRDRMRLVPTTEGIDS